MILLIVLFVNTLILDYLAINIYGFEGFGGMQLKHTYVLLY